ncbi:Hypothetical predicted protein [Octopus vulgaris]|uniref:Uncharacterized protein n=1 Tax=Octopus vulgaris TaxID=6645 RepID=A0AA36AP09_OCTVU|nr:Hypothetical predicted protein [Octopus vulgaris]
MELENCWSAGACGRSHFEKKSLEYRNCDECNDDLDKEIFNKQHIHQLNQFKKSIENYNHILVLQCEKSNATIQNIQPYIHAN